MKLVLVLSVCVACALADVSHIVGKDTQIVRQDNDASPDGNYQWSFENSDGTKSGARGEIKDPNAENPTLSVQGETSYISPEGETVQLQYLADENGFQPQGSHIPTPPPIPEAILRALEYIRAHPPKPE